jgi:hypothetical protein
MLLVNLTGSLDAISAAELRTLDLATTFPTRDVTWDERPNEYILSAPTH